MADKEVVEQLARSLEAGELSRRRFVGRALRLGLGVPLISTILDACTPAPSAPSQSTTPAAAPVKTDNKTIRVLSIDVVLQDAYLKKFTEDTGYTVQPITDTLTGVMVKMLTSSGQYDAVNENASYLAPLVQAGVIAPIPVDKIPNWQYAYPLWTDPNASGNKDGWPISQVFTDNTHKAFNSVPAFMNLEALGYNSARAASVTSYSVLFDPTYKGKVSIWNDALWTIGMTANYLTKSGQMPAPSKTLGDLTKPEVDQVIKFLKQKKADGQFRAIWTDYGQIVNLMASEEAWVSDGWNPAIEDAKRQSGLALKYTNPAEGNRPWFHGTSLTKNSQNPDGAYVFANWLLGGWFGAQVAQQGWYSTAKTVEQAMKPEDYKFWYAGGGRDSGSYDERAANIAYWPGFPTEYDYYLNSWSSFLAS